jgi:hypothetical protein
MFLEPLDARRVMAFSPFSEYAIAPNSHLDVAGDFNGDSRADLVVTNGSRTQLFVSTSNGNLAAPTDVNLQGPSLATGDLNGDGNLDLASASGIALGNGDGTFQSPLSINLPPMIPAGYHAPVAQWAGSVAVGDINGDGTLDLAVTGRSEIWVLKGSGGYGGVYYDFYSSGFVNVLLGNGDGTLQPALVSEFSQQSSSESAALAQLSDDNGDNVIDAADHLDLITKFRNGNTGGYVLLGQGNGSFSGATYVPSAISDKVLLGDFDEDGHLDLLSQTLTELRLNRGLPGGVFASPTSLNLGGPTSTPRSLAVGDIDADGHLDIAVTTQRVYLQGYGYYDNPYPYYGWVAGTVHDGVKVILGNGNGTFSAPITSTLGVHDGLSGNVHSSLLADVNGDGRLDLALADQNQARLTVALNDGQWVPPAALYIDDVAIVEGDSGQKLAAFTVTAVGEHTGVSVAYTTQDDTAAAGQDYTATSGVLTFAAGEKTKTISVPILGDRSGEWTESFYVMMSNSSGAILVDAQALGTILDNEPTVSIDHAYEIDPLTVVEGDVGTTPAVFTVTLSQSYDQEVTVHYWTSTGHVNDIIAADGTLRFAPGETTKTISVAVVGDLVDESLEAFNIYLDTPSANASIESGAGYCYIEDNDPAPTVSIGDVSKSEGNSGTTRFTFTLTLSALSEYGGHVEFATGNGTATTANQDYVAKSGYVYFEVGRTTATISIDVKGDNTKEADELFYVNLISSSATIIDSQGVGTIVNDDGGTPSPTPPKISIDDASIVEGNSGAKLLVFTVSLSRSSSTEVRVNYATANDTAKTGDNDYESKSGTIRFAPGETTKTISITINGDKKFEQDETFKVKLSSAVNGEIADSQGLGKILNDDVRGASSKRHLSARVFDAAFADWLSCSANKRRK